MKSDFQFISRKETVTDLIASATASAAAEALEVVKDAAKKNLGSEYRAIGDHLVSDVRLTDAMVVGKLGSQDQEAPLVEFGTGEPISKNAHKTKSDSEEATNVTEASPFLRPAFRQNKQVIQQLLDEEYNTKFNGGG